MKRDTPSFLQAIERILGGQSLRWIALGIVSLLAILVLSLPPISLWSKLFSKEPLTTPATQLATLVSPTATATMPAEESPSPTPSPAPTSTPTEAVPTETPQPTSVPTTLPSPTLTPTPKPDAVVNAGMGLNLRAGPGTFYEILTVLNNGIPLKVLGKEPTGVWYQVETGDEKKGWVHRDYVILNIPADSIPVSSEIPPTPTPTSTPESSPTPALTGTPGASPTPTPTKTPAPPPPAPTGFGYGIQVDLAYGDPGPILDWVAGMGFNWVKWQVPWKWNEPQKGNIQWGRMDEVVAAANARGIHMLFSVVKAPDWARDGRTEEEGPPVNYNDYGDFVGALAAHFKGRVRAYEVWNEQNLRREWNTGRSLSAQEYVDLLKVAYARIKAADPGAIVVSGGLTPTGYDDGVIAIDDRKYLVQMYEAGFKNYCDAVGAHPSGYNVPPDIDLERDRTYTDPTATFRGPFDGPSAYHRSWSYHSTMRSYREVMVVYGDGGKKIWPTEFGWASIQNVAPSPAPGYEYAADNTEAEQAQFFVRAFNLAKGWGYVGTMFVWNLNFGVTHGPNDEMAAFGILRPDGSARPAHAALRDMPK